MAEIKVLASPDFEEQSATLTTGPGAALLAIRRRDGESETIDLREHLESVSVKTEEEIRSLTGAAGWGILGWVPRGCSSAPSGEAASRRRSASRPT